MFVGTPTFHQKKIAAGSAAGVLLVAALAGCYSGLSFQQDGAADTADDGAGPGQHQDWDGADFAPSFVADDGQIRLLSAAEYKNTVRDLLGVEVSSGLDYADVGSGFDNGSETQLGESLFAILMTEAERVASEYVATTMVESFPCFDAAAPVADGCVESIVEQLGRRAFRRPLDEPMRAQLLEFVATMAPEAEDSVALMELLVVRMLMSPRFLYRTEIGTPLGDGTRMSVLDPFERASLISYSIVGTMPDELLLADAETDRLDGVGIREHVRRLLDTEAGRANAVRFFEQWLRVGELEHMVKAPEEYPKLANAEQAQSLQSEFATFIENIVFDDGGGTFADLLLANVTYVDKHTAPLYGAESSSDELEPLTDLAERGGVLTLASVMAVHASSSEIGRDKPIRRGLLLKNQFMCEEVGLPSGIDVQSAAEGISEDVSDFDALTTREQLELLMDQDPACVACHSTFMPFGYLWSNYDALGQFQTHYGDRPLDASVDELVLDGVSRSYSSIMDVLPDLIESERVSRCFTTNVARYVTGQRQSDLVGFLTEALSPSFREEGQDILQLIEDLFAARELYVRRESVQ
jgi:hypothetical protein